MICSFAPLIGQLNLQPVHFGDLSLNIFQGEQVKSRGTNSQVIAARGQEWDGEISLRIGSEVALFPVAAAIDNHHRTRDRRPTGVAHAAGDRTGVGGLAIDRQRA